MLILPSTMWGAQSDPYWSSVKLLIQPMGSTITDLSSVGRTVTPTGSPTATAPYVNLSSGNVLSCASSSDFDVGGSTPFVIECVGYISSLPAGAAVVFGRDASGSYGASSDLYFTIKSTGAYLLSCNSAEHTSTLTHTTGLANHFGVAYDGTSLKFFTRLYGTGAALQTHTVASPALGTVSTGTVNIGEGLNVTDYGGPLRIRVTVGTDRGYVGADPDLVDDLWPLT